MIRSISSGFTSRILVAIFALATAPAPSLAQSAAPAKPKTGVAAKTPALSSKKAAAASAKAAPKADPKKTAAKPADATPGKPLLVASYGDWGAYAAKTGTTKTCYALGRPKDRTPDNVKRDPAYIFIANRPAENVHNEVSIIMGFDVKGGDDTKVATTGKTPAAAPAASAEVGPAKFVMVAKGSNLWLKNAAEEGPMIDAMRKAGKLIVRAASLKGNVTTDAYSLSGLAQALDRIQKECQ